MEKLGAPQEVLDELKQNQIIEVLPMNWPILEWFVDIRELMRWKPCGRCLGLDLVQVEAEVRLNKRKYKTKHFKLLQQMGLFVAAEINKALE
ncbi:hypothetical protein tloyanaT_13040 [Thalassotalea loyana]|uniref:Uncharacterized protein n=1 Tax=Thalassotalea loyana TaxID=280483 RepID=A0ABQ6HE96_9GAMM|nr:hypothetical protein [Thalassotalea loyana]GLX85052.1 hypothetical protein tloyanaT_13040 [Thalassotalea loyana]